jgi:hypothetical protein
VTHDEGDLAPHVDFADAVIAGFGGGVDGLSGWGFAETSEAGEKWNEEQEESTGAKSAVKFSRHARE